MAPRVRCIDACGQLTHLIVRAVGREHGESPLSPCATRESGVCHPGRGCRKNIKAATTGDDILRGFAFCGRSTGFDHCAPTTRRSPAHGHASGFGTMEISLADLEKMSTNVADSLPNRIAAASFSEATWKRFESEVRATHAVALSRLRQEASERCAELVRLLEIEEQTRCQAFQAVLMSEVRPLVYKRTVRSIIEKLLAKLETFSNEPDMYRGAAQCLSEYMSSLNHHSEMCIVMPNQAELPALDAIAEHENQMLDTGNPPPPYFPHTCHSAFFTAFWPLCPVFAHASHTRPILLFFPPILLPAQHRSTRRTRQGSTHWGVSLIRPYPHTRRLACGRRSRG